MSGVAPDPLDRLEERAFRAATEGGEIFGEGWIPTLTIDVPTVLALVEVARAARTAVEHDPDETDGRQHLYDLAAALTRLETQA